MLVLLTWVMQTCCNTIRQHWKINSSLNSKKPPTIDIIGVTKDQIWSLLNISKKIELERDIHLFVWDQPYSYVIDSEIKLKPLLKSLHQPLHCSIR